MPVWKTYIDSLSKPPLQIAEAEKLLLYEYGYCAAVMDANKTAAQSSVRRFKQHVEKATGHLHAGHHEMYMSAVYVYELRLKESFHPVQSLRLARKAVDLAPEDPITLTYCGMALFYAPKPFGDKKEALQLFLRAEQHFRAQEWYNCWLRPAAMMYIAQCYDKAGDNATAVQWAERTLDEYPEYDYIRYTYLPQLLDAD